MEDHLMNRSPDGERLMIDMEPKSVSTQSTSSDISDSHTPSYTTMLPLTSDNQKSPIDQQDYMYILCSNTPDKRSPVQHLVNEMETPIIDQASMKPYSVESLLHAPRHSTPTKETSDQQHNNVLVANQTTSTWPYGNYLLNSVETTTLPDLSHIDQLYDFIKGEDNSGYAPVDLSRDQNAPSHTATSSYPVSINKVVGQTTKKHMRHPEKPPYTYVAMIIIAIETSERKALSLREIRERIIDMFPSCTFFTGEYKGWKESVRHGVSRSPCFEKVLEFKDVHMAGKPSCWLWKVNHSKVTPHVFNRHTKTCSTYKATLHEELGIPPVCVAKYNSVPKVSSAQFPVPSHSTAKTNHVSLPSVVCVNQSDNVSVEVYDSDDFLSARCDSLETEDDGKNADDGKFDDEFGVDIENSSLPSYLDTDGLNPTKRVKRKRKTKDNTSIKKPKLHENVSSVPSTLVSSQWSNTLSYNNQPIQYTYPQYTGTEYDAAARNMYQWQMWSRAMYHYGNSTNFASHNSAYSTPDANAYYRAQTQQPNYWPSYPSYNNSYQTTYAPGQGQRSWYAMPEDCAMDLSKEV